MHTFLVDVLTRDQDHVTNKRTGTPNKDTKAEWEGTMGERGKDVKD